MCPIPSLNLPLAILSTGALFLILLIYSLTTLGKGWLSRLCFKLVLNLVPGSFKTSYICLLESHSLPDA